MTERNQVQSVDRSEERWQASHLMGANSLFSVAALVILIFGLTGQGTALVPWGAAFAQPSAPASQATTGSSATNATPVVAKAGPVAKPKSSKKSKSKLKLPGISASKLRAGKNSKIVGSFIASKEKLTAVFTGVSGYWKGNPKDLSKGFKVELSAKVATIDTGVGLRDKHAREYFHADKHPLLKFSLTKVNKLKALPGGKIGFDGVGDIVVMKKRVKTPVKATAMVVKGKLVVEAELSVFVSKTPMEAGDTFDRDEVKVTATIIFEPKKKENK